MGYFDGDKLIAVMDFIMAYPDEKTAFIGFFMTDVSVQNAGVGSGMIDELCRYLKSIGLSRVKLGWVSSNSQFISFLLVGGDFTPPPLGHPLKRGTGFYRSMSPSPF